MLCRVRRLSSSSSSAESQESIDGDLAARVFGLLSLMDTGGCERVSVTLDRIV